VSQGIGIIDMGENRVLVHRKARHSTAECWEDIGKLTVSDGRECSKHIVEAYQLYPAPKNQSNRSEALPARNAVPLQGITE
jgi:hypothetical protein